MSPDSRRHRALVIAIIAIGLVLPPLIYWLAFGRATVSPARARALLSARTAVLVDLGLPLAPATPSAAGAVRWSLASVLAAQGPGDVPLELRGRRLLLICPGGMHSAHAALHLRHVGIADASAIRGGIQDWLAAVPGCSPAVLLHANPATDAAIPAFRDSPVYEQWLAIVTFFGVKLLYSALSAGVAGVLWRRTEPDLTALRRAMICFFVGEAFCFINVMVFFEDSLLMEHLHGAGMVLALAFTVYALLEGLDSRFVHFSDDSRCAAAPLCGRCVKHNDVPCGLRRLFMLLLPALAILAALPLSADVHEEVYNTRIFGVLHAYRHAAVHQIYELRYLPIVAIALLANCLLVLGRHERRPVPISKILFSAAAGAMGFSLFRLIVVAPFAANQVWFVAWEETTEFLSIALVAAVLVVFGRGLFAVPSHTRVSQPA